ncbi:MAG: ABC transporter permease subunit [Gammaproteobacteria bacterium]|nr:ABC transporter permease subunit [Gammaproteobacteria bacterium]
MSALGTRDSDLAGGRRWLPDRWLLAALATAGLVALPIATIVFRAAEPAQNIWSHLIETILPTYMGNTLWLVLGVGAGTVCLGASTAWLVTMYRFPGRAIFTWALLLPLAVPSYILAFVITDQLEYAGTVQVTLRALFGWSSPRDYWFPEIRSIGAATAVLTLVLYPYVYLLSRAAFVEQCVELFEVSRTLGSGPLRTFFCVALPMARPAIAVGTALALMETLNEYGTVSFFAVPTIAAGIFDVWLNMDNPAGAAQMALLLVVIALLLVYMERAARHRSRYYATTRQVRALPQTRLPRSGAWLATAWCLLPIVLGFVLPASVLCAYAIDFYTVTLAKDYVSLALNSLYLAGWAALGTTVIGVVLAYGVRLSQHKAMRGAAELATIGYAIPGAVLAVGIMFPLGTIDNTLDRWSQVLFDYPLGLLLSGTGAALVVGYCARFSAIGYRTIDAGLSKVTPSMEGAARTLGAGPGRTLWQVHLPLIKPSVVAAALLVFVDTMKELPLTLILRPFNFETLATFVFQYASEELLEECALGALTIVGAGIVPVILISRTLSRARPGHLHA